MQSSMRREGTVSLKAARGRIGGAFADVIVGLLVTAGLAGGLWLGVGGAPGNVLLAALALAVIALPVAWHWPVDSAAAGLGAANRVTLARAVAVALFIGFLPAAPDYADHGWWLALAALATLGLDGIDGWVARRFGASRIGARFDMELDALFILVLAAWLAALDKAGVWVLLLGAMRYVFLLAGWLYSPLRAPLPERYRRKAVCVFQVLILLVGLAPPLSPTLVSLGALAALALLFWSFAVDVAWLLAADRRRRYAA